MTLHDFINDKSISMAEFGRLAGISNRQNVCRYVAGRIPTKDVMHRIYLATGGKVTPNDFYDLPAANRPTAPAESERGAA